MFKGHMYVQVHGDVPAGGWVLVAMPTQWGKLALGFVIEGVAFAGALAWFLS